MVQTTGQYFRIAALSIARLRPAITRDPYMIQYPHFCSLGVLWVSMLGSYVRSHGEVPERSNGAVSKTVVLLAGDRGFESLPLRHSIKNLKTRINVDVPSPVCYEKVLRKVGWDGHENSTGPVGIAFATPGERLVVSPGRSEGCSHGVRVHGSLEVP